MNIIQINWRLQYNPKLKERTRELRKNMTEPEKKLWFWFLRKISNWEIKLSLSYKTSPSIDGGSGELVMRNLRVYRQRLIDNFIVDFYIPKLKLVIEIDWESHFDKKWIAYDIERTQILKWLWLKVIRFTNEEVMKNFNWVCESLKREFLYN